MSTGTNGAHPAPPKSTRRSDLPDPYDKYAISEDLTKTERELVAVKAKDEQRAIREALTDSKLETVMDSQKWTNRLLAGAIVGVFLKFFLDYLMPVSHVIGGGP